VTSFVPQGKSIDWGKDPGRELGTTLWLLDLCLHWRAEVVRCKTFSV